MGDKSSIEWTNATWNPSVGCTKISPGCDNCYAATLHARLTEMGQTKYAQPFSKVRTWDRHLRLPLTWKEPRMIFVNSMSDLFHKELPLEYVKSVFAVMAEAQQHTFQVLTKRSGRVAQLAAQLDWPKNIWMGVSIEDQAHAYRAAQLATVPAAVRFLSVEPLLEDIRNLPLDGIDWVILGGESGAGFRKLDREWARSIRDQCRDAGVAFFFKQWGGIRPKSGGNRLDGKTWMQFPTPKQRQPELQPSLL